MNKRKKEFFDNLPDWLRIVTDPKSETDHRLAGFMNNLKNLPLLLFHGELQAHVDHEMPLEFKQNVCRLLHSWGIMCTLNRLEIKSSDVVKRFVPQYVTVDTDDSPLIHLNNSITLIYGDVGKIKSSWPDEKAPSYLALNPFRMHLLTFFDLCAMSDVSKFEELYLAVFGPLHQPATANKKKDTKAVKVKLSIEKEEMEWDDAWAMRFIDMKLGELNETLAEDVCSICLDQLISGQCGHETRCEACATMLSLFVERKLKKKNAASDECSIGLDAVQVCVRYLCLFTDLGESVHRNKRNMDKLRSFSGPLL